MRIAKCKQCGTEADAFVCGEDGRIQDIEPKIDKNGLPIISVIRFFRTREGFENWMCEICDPPIDYDEDE